MRYVRCVVQRELGGGDEEAEGSEGVLDLPGGDHVREVDERRALAAEREHVGVLRAVEADLEELLAEARLPPLEANDLLHFAGGHVCA
jgi:hypothetical protein